MTNELGRHISESITTVKCFIVVAPGQTGAKKIDIAGHSSFFSFFCGKKSFLCMTD